MRVTVLGRGDQPSHCPIPLFGERLSAGFPSPAEGFEERRLDLNDLCIQRPAATYFVRVEGESMTDAGILDGDILVVDRSVTACQGDVVVAALHGEFTVKELRFSPSPALVAHHRDYADIALSDATDAEIFGVVVSVVRQLRTG